MPSAPAREHLASWLAEQRIDEPIRWTSADQWHITLGFFGDDDDPDRREKWLRRRIGTRPAPTMRLAGGGTWPHVLWAGVDTEGDADAHHFARLAHAAGAGRQEDRLRFRPHVTVARWRTGSPDQERLIALFAGYTGPWFAPTEVLLISSAPTSGAHTYTTVASLPLVHA